MAKLYKMEMYILDINEDHSDLEEIICSIESSVDVNFITFNEKQVDVEWDDNLKINMYDATEKDFKEYFK